MTTPQASVNSPFGPAKTAEDVIAGIDLTCKTAVVTGGYSGLGLEVVRALVKGGATVVVPVRNEEKARNNLAQAGLDNVATSSMDLMDSASIHGFAQGVISDHATLDLLVNCAGIMATPLARDSRGYESQFSTNVLGHFQLICELWPALVAAEQARVISLSSSNHRVKVTDFLHDPNVNESEYSAWVAYARSKAANALIAVALDNIGKHLDVRAFAVHPGGIVDTGLLSGVEDQANVMEIAKAVGMIDDAGQPIIDPENGWKTPQQDASTIVWAATSPLLDGKGGVYLSDNDIAPAREVEEGEMDQVSVAPSVVDPVNAGRLWRLCEELTGVCLD